MVYITKSRFSTSFESSCGEPVLNTEPKLREVNRIVIVNASNLDNFDKIICISLLSSINNYFQNLELYLQLGYLNTFKRGREPNFLRVAYSMILGWPYRIKIINLLLKIEKFLIVVS